MIDDTLALLDEMNEAGRIEYDDYRALHDAVSVIALPAPDAEHLLSVVETIKETGGSVQIRGVLITPCDTYGQPLTSVRPDADVAEVERIGAILREHQPTSGVQVASGVTCRCGYWTGEERPGVTQQIAASKDEAVEAAVGALNRVRELHQPVDIEPSGTVCGVCSFRLPYGRYFGKIVDWPCATIQALDATPPATATGEGDDRG